MTQFLLLSSCQTIIIVFSFLIYCGFAQEQQIDTDTGTAGEYFNMNNEFENYTENDIEYYEGELMKLLGCLSDDECDEGYKCYMFSAQEQADKNPRTTQSICLPPSSEETILSEVSSLTATEKLSKNDGISSSSSLTLLYEGCQHDDDCPNYGNCLFFLAEDGGRSSACHCAGDYKGENCLAKCDAVCLNGGTCIGDDLTNELRCQCAPGYTGLLCALLISDTIIAAERNTKPQTTAGVFAVTSLACIFSLLLVGYIIVRRRRQYRVSRNNSQLFNDGIWSIHNTTMNEKTTMTIAELNQKYNLKLRVENELI